MKILVLGSQGMAGHMIFKYLRDKNYDVTPAARPHLRVEDVESINSIVLNDYDFVINCIGLLVQDSNTNPDKAILINSWFPHYLENILKNSKTRLIHLSTDCVFDGKKGNYVESDIHTETNFYGRSKSLGEVNNHKDITFRMSIIGTELKNGTGLLNWVLNNNDTVLPGWDNAWWNGITTLQLAKSIEQYMLDPKITGVYHLVSNKHCINKYELLKLINEIYGLGKEIRRTTGPKDINKILVNTRTDLEFDIPSYRTMLEEIKEYVKTTIQLNNQN